VRPNGEEPGPASKGFGEIKGKQNITGEILFKPKELEINLGALKNTIHM